MAYLYRGVNCRLYDELRGELKPRGDKPAVAVRHDGKFKYDGTWTYGSTTDNAARAHRKQSGLYGGSFVSFTRDIVEACRFATEGFTEPGWIYVVDPTLLDAAGVIMWEADDAEWADEQEVSLSARDGSSIPPGVVVEQYQVDARGNRVVDP
jgi:hypothetical protein